MRYLRGSATGPAAEVQFSIDGGETFATPEMLARAAGGGKKGQRKSLENDYTHVRWVLKQAARPGLDRAAALSRDVLLTRMALPLAEILGPDGPLARALPGYAARPQQIAMAEHVAAALAGTHATGRRGGHRHRQDLRLPRAGAAVGPRA